MRRWVFLTLRNGAPRRSKSSSASLPLGPPLRTLLEGEAVRCLGGRGGRAVPVTVSLTKPRIPPCGTPRIPGGERRRWTGECAWRSPSLLQGVGKAFLMRGHCAPHAAGRAPHCRPPPDKVRAAREGFPSSPGSLPGLSLRPLLVCFKLSFLLPSPL